MHTLLFPASRAPHASSLPASVSAGVQGPTTAFGNGWPAERTWLRCSVVLVRVHLPSSRRARPEDHGGEEYTRDARSWQPGLVLVLRSVLVTCHDRAIPCSARRDHEHHGWIGKLDFRARRSIRPYNPTGTVGRTLFWIDKGAEDREEATMPKGKDGEPRHLLPKMKVTLHCEECDSDVAEFDVNQGKLVTVLSEVRHKHARERHGFEG